MIETNNNSKCQYQQMATITKSNSNVNKPIINNECPFFLKFIVYFPFLFFIVRASWKKREMVVRRLLNFTRLVNDRLFIWRKLA